MQLPIPHLAARTPLAVSSASRLIFPRSLRVQLVSALGALGLLVGLVSGLAWWGTSRTHELAHAAVHELGTLTHHANAVALATLQCRRYEKDLFLTLNDPQAQAAYLSSWQQADADLERAITAFAHAATLPADRAQAADWQQARGVYAQGMREVVAAIRAGDITSPAAANAALTPVKDHIRALTESASAVAAARTASGLQSEVVLEAVQQQTLEWVLILGGSAVVLALVWSILVPSAIARSVSALTLATGRVAAGDLGARVGVQRRDELGQLAHHFNTMAAALEARVAAGQAQAAEQRRLQEAVVQAQDALLAELSTPLIPLSDGVVIMPLIGSVDSMRAQRVLDTLLGGVAKQRARVVIVDITGVRVIDTAVAGLLVRAGQAVRLLGAEVVLTGVRAEVAQTMVTLDIDLRGIVTFSSVQHGIAYALARR